MDLSVKLVIGLFLIVSLGLLITGLAAGQSTIESIGTSQTSTINGTQVLPIFIPQQKQTQSGQAESTDQTGLFGLVSLVVTTIAIPIVTKMLKNKDEETRKQAQAENHENEFRLIEFFCT